MRLVTVCLIACMLGVAADAVARPKPKAQASAPPSSGKVNLSGSKVTIIGARALSREQLEGALGNQVRDINEQGITPARADDAAYYLGSFYRKQGFARATVDYELRGSQVLLRVQEGPRTLLRRLSFTGNRTISSATLFEYMIGAPPERLIKEPEQFPYNESEIAAGVDRVRGLYIAEGFLDAQVEANPVRLTANGTAAEVTVRIQERQRYTVGAVRFTGQTLFRREELIANLKEPVTGNFSATRVTAMERSLEFFYKTRGYYEASVKSEADPSKAVAGRVGVTFHVTPGAQFRFDGVRVQGTDRLRPGFLPKRFEHLKGEIYNPQKVDETYRELLRTSVFKRLSVVPVPQPDRTVRLDLTVEEARAKEVGFTIGAGSYEGVSLGLRLADRNLFGGGRPLTFAADYSTRGLRGELLWVDPWLFDSNYGLRARLYTAARTEKGYSRTETGLRFDLTRDVVARLELGTFIEVKAVSVTPEGIEETLIGPLDYLLASIGLTQVYDRRDHPINPTRGQIFTSSVDLSTIDGEQAFSRVTMRFSSYHPVGKSCLLALGARAGLILPVIEQIPIDVRFFSGGATTVRSFAERELGPKDKHDNPLGGEYWSVFNAEFLFPLVNALQGAVFVDAGNLTGEGGEPFADIRYALGLGLRYKLPIGPIRVDYGVNPDRRADEKIGAFHFSFGFAF